MRVVSGSDGNVNFELSLCLGMMNGIMNGNEWLVLGGVLVLVSSCCWVYADAV